MPTPDPTDAKGTPFTTDPPPAGMSAAGAVVFGAPHGTPYDGIDNRPHAGSAAALRTAIAEDWAWRGHWDFDLGGPLLGGGAMGVLDLGDLPTRPEDGPGNRDRIREATAGIVAAGAVPMMIGGDDSVPIPFIEALAPLGPLAILQIDAHIDWREERRGERMGFSSTMRRASEMAHVARIVQVGMRAVGSARAGEVEAARAWGAEIVPAARVHAEGIGAALAHVPDGAACLVTVDCDALDPSVMPAVMAPAPGGLTYTQVAGLIAGVAAKARIAAFDIVEFVPARDPTGTAAHAAARLLWHAIARVARASGA